MKMLIKIHRGLNKSLKIKIVDDYLVSYKKKEWFANPNFALGPSSPLPRSIIFVEFDFSGALNCMFIPIISSYINSERSKF